MSKKGFWAGYWDGRKGNRPSLRSRRIQRWRTRPSNLDLQKQITKLKSGQVGKEWKTHDVTGSGNVLNTGTFYNLTEIAQGNTSLTREGLKIALCSIWIKIFFYNNTTHNSAHEMRMMIFRDNGNENDTTAPTITGDLLESSEPHSFTDHQIKGRYKIYYDKIIIINPNASGLSKAAYKKYYKRFKTPKKVFYTNTAAADLGKGQFYMVLIGSTASNYATMNFKARMKFTG